MTGIMVRLRAGVGQKTTWLVTLLAVGHLIWTNHTIGLRPEHIAADLLLALPAWFSVKGRLFSRLCVPVWLAGGIYENFHFVAEQLRNVHIGQLYHLEQALFGIETAQGRIIPAEWFAIHNWPALDFVCGLSYMFYLYIPIFLPMIFVFYHRERQPRMAWTFFATQMIGLTIFTLYPAAPPWYVHLYGFGPPRFDVLSSPAGTARWDALTGIHYFHNFYKYNATVFGAMPSLHFADPFGVFLSLMGMKKRWWVSMLLFSALVGFSTFYFQHHYLLDVIAGGLVAFAAFNIVLWVEYKEQLGGHLRGITKYYTWAPPLADSSEEK